MCGINGILAYGRQAEPPSERQCVAVRDAMAARGPDGKGLYRDPEGRLLLGHRRLAIIDLSDAGAQPMVSADGELAVTFNGEIYNYRELRDELQADGVQLTGESDTEVLLHLYRRDAEGMVDRLAGMFAFALWDRRNATLLLARDPHGIKPLYYADDGSTFRFASSVRALVAGGGISRDPDPTGIVGFLAWGSVPEPNTLHRQIHCLPAGSTLKVSGERVGEPRRYWSAATVYDPPMAVPGQPELHERVREALLESVSRHLVADVPVGLFLSAGVDSGALLGIAAELHPQPLRTVTLAFEEFRGTSRDEAALAEEVARHYGAEHTTQILTADQVRQDLPRFLDAMDQPTVDGLNVYWISRAVRKAGLKAALSGLGGDELFGGYDSFPKFSRLRRLARLAPIAGAFSALAVAAPRRQRAKLRYLQDALPRPASTYHLLRGLFTPAEIQCLVRPEIWQAAGGSESITRPVEAAWRSTPGLATLDTPWRQTTVAEQCIYMRQQLLRDADWTAMSHGLELRVPLVDRRLTATLGPRLADSQSGAPKAPLAASPRPSLPPSILSRPKTGFSLPMETWCREAYGTAPTLPTWLAGPQQQANIRSLADRAARGHLHWSRLWALQVLEHLLPEV